MQRTYGSHRPLLLRLMCYVTWAVTVSKMSHELIICTIFTLVLVTQDELIKLIHVNYHLIFEMIVVMADIMSTALVSSNIAMSNFAALLDNG